MLALEEALPYIHTRVGFNYRMTEVQSICGINELARFDSWNMPRRKAYAKMYDEAFAGLKGVTLPYAASHSFMEFVLNLDGTGKSVAEVNKALLARHIFGGYDLSREMPQLGQSQPCFGSGFFAPQSGQNFVVICFAPHSGQSQPSAAAPPML